MAQPGQGRAAEVLVLLSDSDGAARFAEMLARSRRVTISQSDAAIGGRYDLGIVDGPMLQRIWRRIAERKRAEAPTFLPFLLVTTSQDVGLFARFLWTAVDELIQAPVQTPELLARVDVLLRVREASVGLRDHGEERLRQFFDADPASKWVAAPDGRILLCNAAFAAHIGFPSVDEACRHTWSDVIADPVAAADFSAQLASGTLLDGYEMELTRTDGGRIQVLQYAVPRLEDGRLMEVHGYLVDVSEHKRRKRRVDMVERLEAIGNLAGGVAHNFNNTLGTILGYADLLKTDLPLGDPRRQEIEEIRGAALRSAELTRQLLAFGRRQRLRPTELNVNDLVTAMERTFHLLLGDRFDVILTLDEAIGPVLADRNQLEQVLLNLVLNSRDALADRERGELRLETAAIEIKVGGQVLSGVEIPQGAYTALRVHDTGKGMDSTTRTRAFEPFFSTKRQGETAGMGLATAYGIVKQSGGFIGIDSEPGRGTTVTVYLPVAMPVETHPASADASPSLAGEPAPVVGVA